jgi:WD repeat-containing protein 55
MFDTICTLPLSSDLFAQALHPSLPILAVGLSSGHVQQYRLPPAPTSTDTSDSDEEDYDGGVQLLGSRPRRLSSAASENGLGEIETAWRTRRHPEGSCRCLGFSTDGDVLYSAGTDSLLKAAKAENGKVCSKVAIPKDNG